MRIDAIKLGLATAIVFAVVWVICSLLVFSMPLGMMQMGGHMTHADFGPMAWTLTWTGFIIGLVAWSILAGVLAWAIAAVYNSLVGEA